MLGENIKYRVYLVSKPGMYEQYSGHVDVVAGNELEAEDKAFKRLRKSFPDRNRSMWMIIKIEVRGE